MSIPAGTGRTTVAVPPIRAGRREWLGLAVIALPCMLYSMDLTVLNLAVPRLIADLQPSSTQLLWIVDIYGFVLAGALIPMGRPRGSDRPAPPAADWRGRIRCRVGPGRVCPEC
jgi:MFS family permease